MVEAIVKNIKFTTHTVTRDYHDIFTMDDLIGKTIEVVPKYGCPGWWIGVELLVNFHESWLEFEIITPRQ